jgi:cell division protein FtsI/penicillin-binding protein 2
VTDLRWIPILVPDKAEWSPHFFKWEQLYLKKTKNNTKALLNSRIPKYIYSNKFWAWVYINEAISSLYEPGSIFKWLTVAIWIDTWEIKDTDMYYDKWYVKVWRFTIKNVASACSGHHTYGHALNYSCNVWMIFIARKIGKTLFHDYIKDFWFWEPTRITLDWEVSWKVDPYEIWTKSQLFTTSYWLWISVTPLQMVMSYATIANGWILYRAKILKAIKYKDKWKEYIIEPKPEKIRRVLKESTSKIVTKMLVDSVNRWVAKKAKIPWYLLAWKTWTSDIASHWWYEKWVWSTNASFIWFWPAQDPQFVILVKLRRPRTQKYGWETSAIMFKELSQYLLNHYGISKNLKMK